MKNGYRDMDDRPGRDVSFHTRTLARCWIDQQGQEEDPKERKRPHLIRNWIICSMYLEHFVVKGSNNACRLAEIVQREPVCIGFETVTEQMTDPIQVKSNYKTRLGCSFLSFFGPPIRSLIVGRLQLLTCMHQILFPRKRRWGVL